MSDTTVNPPARAVKPSTVALKLDRPCKICGCPLSIAPDIADGKPVALDAHAGHPIYLLMRDKDGNRYAVNARKFLWELHRVRHGDTDEVAAMMAGIEGVGVAHGATCDGPKKDALTLVQDIVNAGDMDGIHTTNWQGLYRRGQELLKQARMTV